MTYKELYEKAAAMLDRGEITLGDFNKMVKPLDVEIHPVPHWIPCEERLPEKTGRYLAWAVVSFIPDHVDEPNTIKQITIASYSTRTRIWFGDNVEDVIAWMPLPNPFKEDKT